ncbi:hypothetical protein ACROYT_G003750 [Oculina patagonica]
MDRERKDKKRNEELKGQSWMESTEPLAIKEKSGRVDEEQEKSFEETRGCDHGSYPKLLRPQIRARDTMRRSQKGLGAAPSKGKANAYASRALTDTEERYAQIEKEIWRLCSLSKSFISTPRTTSHSEKRPQATETKEASIIRTSPTKTQKYNISVHYECGAKILRNTPTRSGIQPSPAPRAGEQRPYYQQQANFATASQRTSDERERAPKSTEALFNRTAKDLHPLDKVTQCEKPLRQVRKSGAKMYEKDQRSYTVETERWSVPSQPRTPSKDPRATTYDPTAQ